MNLKNVEHILPVYLSFAIQNVTSLTVFYLLYLIIKCISLTPTNTSWNPSCIQSSYPPPPNKNPPSILLQLYWYT